MPLCMHPKGLAYSRHFVRPSICQKPFLHKPWTKLYQTSYMNSLGYCAQALFSVFSSTGRRPASLCHGPLSVVRPSGRPCVNFLAHLSTTCSGGAIVTGHRPSSVRPSVRLLTISLKIFSSKTRRPILIKLGRNVPWVKLYKNC